MDIDPAVVGVTIAALGLAGGFALYIIRGEIGRATKDIQPRNGGKGWSDVHYKLDTVIDRQADVIDDVKYLRARLDDHITDHNKE